MFVFTAKLDKRKLTAALIALVVVVAAIITLCRNGSEDEAASAFSTAVKTNDDRVNFLRSLGWQVSSDPMEQQEVIIPKDFSDVYETYNELQKTQGFDLENYAGLEAVRYTYQVLNYPSADGTVVADIIVYRDTVIAGDIQSIAMGGFMSGLKYPE